MATAFGRLVSRFSGLSQKVASPPLPEAGPMLDYLGRHDDPETFPRTAQRLRAKFDLHNRGPWNPGDTRPPERRVAELGQLSRDPDLAQVFLFHGDGFLREAALHALSGPIRRPVVAYGVLERLNDWSPEVRSAAAQAFDRCFRATAPDILLDAVWIVLANGANWRRWHDGHDRLVEAVLAHAPVAAALIQRLVDGVGGGTGPVFAALSRNARFDPCLSLIAARAAQPSLRARAVENIASGRSLWPLATPRKVWTDKPLGLYRLEPDFGSRPLSLHIDPLPCLRSALLDKSAVVRRKALDALVAHRHDARFRPLIDTCLASLHKADSPAIRARLDFLAAAIGQTP